MFERDRARFVAGRGRMREVMGEVMARSPASLRFVYDGQGKPGLEGGPAFNLSHSGGWAALAVSPGPAVGVDIERHRPIEHAVAERFFSPPERAALDGLSAHDWTAAFFRCWTRKEAFLKACGTGLWRRLDSFDVTLAQDEAARITRIDPEAGSDAGLVEEWTLAHLDLGPGFVGAIALRAPGTVRVIYRDCHPPLRQVSGR